MYEQASIGRDHFDHAGETIGIQMGVERMHTSIDRKINLVTELDEQR